MTGNVSRRDIRIEALGYGDFDQWSAVFILFLVTGIVLAQSLTLNDGNLIFTLDDPYIHLALAENIWQGHYGINLAEPSAPSSSVLWPFFLAPITALGHPATSYALFGFNLAAAVATLLVVFRIFTMIFEPAAERHDRLAVLAAILFVPALNMVGLVFSGMEHSLQVFLSVLLIFGLIIEAKSGKACWWLFLAIIIGPLIRYDNMALSVPATIYLMSRGHWRGGIAAGLGFVIPIILFSSFLLSLGLAAFPTSVLSHSRFVGSGFDIMVPINAFIDSIGRFFGKFLIFTMVLGISTSYLQNRTSADRRLGLVIAAAALLHLMFGKFGAYDRYEIYIISAATLILSYLYREPLWRILDQVSPLKAKVIMCVLVILVGESYAYNLIDMPIASNNIYEQQYQMHRFATAFYNKPVVINDLGWVAYRNSNFILDILGLASLEAHLARTTRADNEWMNELSERYDAKLAMVYEHWFKGFPDNWIPLGNLVLGKRRITPAGKKVAFYALDEETAARARGLLVDFAATLPAGVRFDTYRPACPQGLVCR